MIDINLIPEDKGRRRKKGGLLHAGFVLPREVIIGLIGGFLVLLVLTHVLLQATIFFQLAQLSQQQQKWEKILPAKKDVDKVMRELQTRQLRYKAIKDIKGCSDVVWAGKLNALSNELPQGVWLQDLMLEDSNFLIRGSSVSKHKVEKINIYNYVKKLKQNKMLMDGVVSMEVESVKNRDVGGTAVADFVIRMVLESDEMEEENAAAVLK